MTGEQLIEVGRELARPCLFLTDEGDGKPIAVWGGPGLVPPPEGPYRHWLSIAGPALADAGIEGLTGCLSVYTDEEGCRTRVVAVDSRLVLPESATDGVPLFGKRERPLPPIDAVFLLGPPVVHEWLAANGWEPHEPCNNNFPDREPIVTYGRAWWRDCPLFGKVFAQLGGWHMPWPDGDWYALMQRRLVAWTLHGSEPWAEVWLAQDGTYEVIQRVT